MVNAIGLVVRVSHRAGPISGWVIFSSPRNALIQVTARNAGAAVIVEG